AGRTDPLAPLGGRIRREGGRVFGIRLYFRVGIEAVLEAQFVVDAVRVVDLDVAGPRTAGHNRSSSTAPSGERRRLRVGVCGFAHLPVILPSAYGARPPTVPRQQCPPLRRQLSTYVFIVLTPECLDSRRHPPITARKGRSGGATRAGSRDFVDKSSSQDGLGRLVGRVMSR